MACQLLTENVPNNVHHDLESFFYILLWIFTFFQGPNNQERPLEDVRGCAILDWMIPDDMKKTGLMKQGLISSSDTFNNHILNYISPYFEEFKPMLRHFRELVFAQVQKERVLTHVEVVKLLVEAMAVISGEAGIITDQQAHTIAPSSLSFKYQPNIYRPTEVDEAQDHHDSEEEESDGTVAD